MKSQQMFLTKGQNCVHLEDGTFLIADNNRPGFDGDYLVSWHPHDQFVTVSRLLSEPEKTLIFVEAACYDLKTGQSDAAYSLCDSFSVDGFLALLREHLLGIIASTHGLSHTAPEDTHLTLSITLRDIEDEAAPAQRVMTVRETLATMKDGDADAAIAMLEAPVLDLNAQTHCGALVISLFTNLHLYLSVIEGTRGRHLHSEVRWNLWSYAVQTARVIVFG